MQTWLIAFGFLLTGQISDSGDGRYAGSDTRTSPSAAALGQPPATAPPLEPPPAAGLTRVVKPAELLQTLTKPVDQQQLAGSSLSLAEAVQSAQSRGEQTRRVSLYWQLSQAVDEYNLAALAEVELQSLRGGIGQAGPAWTPAQEAAAARKRVAESTVRVAQLRLANALGRPGHSSLPLTSDRPHCGAYESRYDQIFRGRTSLEAEQLSRLLPQRHDELSRRAQDASAARDWLVSISQQRNPQSDGTHLLKAYQHLALQRRTFVSAAYQYNDDIARYTELAVPQDVGTVRLVSMLIDSNGRFDGDWQRGSIQRAAAQEVAPQNNGAGKPQRTFAGGERSEARRVPTAEQREGERSILVPPKDSKP